jgi:hypothetical protein
MSRLHHTLSLGLVSLFLLVYVGSARARTPALPVFDGPLPDVILLRGKLQEGESDANN